MCAQMRPHTLGSALAGCDVTHNRTQHDCAPRRGTRGQREVRVTVRLLMRWLWLAEEVAGERRLCLTLVKARPELWWSAIRGHPELDQAALKTVAALYAGAKDGAPCHLPLAIEE